MVPLTTTQVGGSGPSSTLGGSCAAGSPGPARQAPQLRVRGSACRRPRGSPGSPKATTAGVAGRHGARARYVATSRSGGHPAAWIQVHRPSPRHRHTAPERQTHRQESGLRCGSVHSDGGRREKHEPRDASRPGSAARAATGHDRDVSQAMTAPGEDSEGPGARGRSAVERRPAPGEEPSDQTISAPLARNAPASPAARCGGGGAAPARDHRRGLAAEDDHGVPEPRQRRAVGHAQGERRDQHGPDAEGRTTLSAESASRVPAPPEQPRRRRPKNEAVRQALLHQRSGRRRGARDHPPPSRGAACDAALGAPRARRAAPRGTASSSPSTSATPKSGVVMKTMAVRDATTGAARLSGAGVCPMAPARRTEADDRRRADDPQGDRSTAEVGQLEQGR